MPFTSFHERFPEIVKKETRSITVFNVPELPEDTYGLIEAYCDEIDCDCRRVFFNVISSNHKKILATISFGWDSDEYYAKWFGTDDPEVIKDLVGPALNQASSQSKLASPLLEQVKAVLQDNNYVERLKRHYLMFKAEIEKEDKRIQKQKMDIDSNYNIPSSRPKVGRNDPCPCGSGRKYKKCCINNNQLLSF